MKNRKLFLFSLCFFYSLNTYSQDLNIRDLLKLRNKNTDEAKPQSNYLYEAGKQMNNAVTLNIIGTICLATSPLLVKYNTVEKVYKSSNGISTTFPVSEIDYSLVYISIGAGIVFNIISINSWYNCSNSLKEASKQNKISYKISPLGANLAYRF